MLYLTDVQKNGPCISFLSGRVWKRFFDYRYLRQAYNGIENTSYKEDDLGNLLIYSPCREKINPDIIIVYVPNFMFTGGTPFFYLEYLMTLHSLLLLQGFRNPQILIVNLNHLENNDVRIENSNTEFLPFSIQLDKLLKTWEILVSESPNAKLFLFGDSSGAILILYFMILLHHINELASQKDDISEKTHFQIYGVILISPLLSDDKILEENGISEGLFKRNTLDYVSYELIKKFEMGYKKLDIKRNAQDQDQDQNENNNSVNDGLVTKLLNKQFLIPTRGIVLSYGEEEYLSQEIKELGNILKSAARVKIWKKKNGVHSWPMVSFSTEDAQDEKEDHVFILAGIISRMTIWFTDEYLDPEIDIEPMNLLTIDDDHL
ncbi:hypothetical protein B5S28_g5185 [[Candida] boidinii]|nr:hypothetical protein B5S28_g5185 [[Candida] boidinii]OWB64359.1 hypothetical protein B5S29_g5442 [[Candida] boidinii]OWB74927.1 hypothetical protein B5S31_g4762 [[Candida] boidinii]